MNFKNTAIFILFCFLYTNSQTDSTNEEKKNEKEIKKSIDTLNQTEIKKKIKISPPVKPVLKLPKKKLLITRAGEASSAEDVQNSWFSALTEAYFYFQLQNYESCDVIPRKEFLKSLKRTDGYGVTIPKETICQVAKSLRASHVLIHSYNYNKNSLKKIDYLVEIVNPKNKKTIMSHDTSFNPDSIDSELRDYTEKILKKLNITLTDREKGILKRKVFSLNSKINKDFGIAVADINDRVTVKTSSKILKYSGNDPDFALAAFKAAGMYEALENYTRSSTLYSQIIHRNGFYSSRLYIKAASNYRKRTSYDQALRILSLAEKKGVKSIDIYLEKALNYEKRGNPLGTRECYEEILKLDPNQPDAILFIARDKTKDGLYQESLDLLSRIKPTASNIAPLNLEKGENYLALGKNKQALTALQSARKVLPDNQRVSILLGEINLKLKKYRIASDHFKNAFEKQQNNLGLLLKTSHAYKMAKQPQKALDILSKYKPNFYDSKLVDKEIGILKFFKGDTASARSILETCINIKPPDSSVFMVLGDIYATAGDKERAIAMYERAEPLVKDSLSIKLALANLYLNKKEYTHAESRFRSIISVNPQFPQANRYLADILSVKGQNAKALELYKKERKYHGGNIYIQQKIAELLYKLNDLTNAQKETEKLVKLDQSNASAYFQLSIIAAKQKRISDAKRYYKKGESLGKSTRDNYLILGEGFASNGSHNEAIDAYNKVLKSDSLNEKVLIELSKLYISTKQDSLAAQTYQAIYNIDPNKNSPYLIKAGHIYYKKQNKDKAYSLYNKFVAQGHKDPVVSINLAEIEFEKKQYQKTISLLEGLEEKYLSDTRVVKMLALSYNKTGTKDLPIPTIEKMLSKEPDDKNIIEMAAIAYEKKGDLSSAAKMFKKYLSFPRTDSHQNYAYRLAAIYEKMNNKSLTEKQYASNIKIYPDDFRNYLNLTEHYISEKKYQPAEAILIKATKRPSCPSELFKKLANIYDSQKKTSQAGAIYEKYLKAKPQDYEVWGTLGSLYFSQNKYEQAIAPLEKNIKHNPDELSNYYKLGYSYFKTKQFGKAIGPLKKALPSKSDSSKILLLLTQCYTMEKDTTNLIAILNKRIELHPDDYKLYLETGKLLLSAKQYEEAIQAFETANKIKPGDVKVLLDLVELYETINNKSKWIVTIDKVLKNFPKNHQIHFKKALYHIAQNELEKAKASLKKTLNLRPNHTLAHYNYAQLLEKEKQYKTAHSHFHQAYKAEPDNIDYVFKFAEISILLGKHSIALEPLNRAIKQEPDNIKILRLLASVHYAKKQYSKAEPLFLRSLEIDRDCHTCYEHLGIISYKRKDYPQASTYLGRSVQHNDTNYTIFLFYANSLLFQNQLRKAHTFYKKAFEINPENDEVYYHFIASCINVGLEKKAETTLDLNKNRGKNGWTYLAKARILELSGDYTKAHKNYNSALKSLPDNPDVHKGLGRINLSRKKYNTAIQNFSRAMAEIPDDFENFVGMGKAFYYLKDYQSSLELFKEILPKQTKNIEIYTMMGLSYSGLKKHESAIGILRQGLKIEGKNADIHFALGNEYEKNSQFKKAILSFRNSAKFNKEIAVNAYRNIGDIYYHKLKSNKSAKKYYKKYIQAGGTDSKVRSIIGTL